NIQPSGNVLVCTGADTLLCADAGFAIYQWSGGNTSSCITATAGNYSITVIDNFGCSGVDSVSVSERAVPVPNIQPAGNVIVCAGNDTLLCADAGFAFYQWSGGNTTNCVTATSGNYSLT